MYNCQKSLQLVLTIDCEREQMRCGEPDQQCSLIDFEGYHSESKD